MKQRNEHSSRASNLHFRQETNPMLLKDKVALITGGAGLNGLGFATARLMASHGARVVVLGLARAMAREFGPEGIRVNSITPGLIGTDIIKGKLTEDKKAEIAETIPLARLGRADDIGGACVFLASDLSLYCTGITLDVNGGMLIH